MAYVFELTFDPATEATIRTIWRRISDAGLPSSLDAAGYRPHISLAVYDAERFDVDGCYQKAADYARTVAPFSVHLSHVGVFVDMGNVVFLGVTPSAALLARHREALDLCCGQREFLRRYYAPSLWTPHVSLSFNLTHEQTGAILAMSWEMDLPLSGQVQALHLVEVTPDYARDICTCEFSGPKAASTSEKVGPLKKGAAATAGSN